MKKSIQEFKEFVTRGNVIELAIGVIIGASFSQIVNSLVKDILMPLLSILTGKINLSTLSIRIPNTGSHPILIQYGIFLQNVFNFFLIALCIFLFTKLVKRISRNIKEKLPDNQKKKKDKKEELTKEESLLIEIRNLLRDQNTYLTKDKEAIIK